MLDTVKNESYKDSTLIMQLLRDNLTVSVCTLFWINRGSLIEGSAQYTMKVNKTVAVRWWIPWLPLNDYTVIYLSVGQPLYCCLLHPFLPTSRIWHTHRCHHDSLLKIWHLFGVPATNSYFSVGWNAPKLLLNQNKTCSSLVEKSVQ